MTDSAGDTGDALRRATRLMARFVRDGGGVADRDEAIGLFEEALAAGLPADRRPLARAGLGTLLMLRAFPAPLGADPTGTALMAFGARLAAGRVDEAGAADAARAVGHLREVVDDPAAEATLRAQARVQLAALHLMQGHLDLRSLRGLLEAGQAVPDPSLHALTAGLVAVVDGDGGDPRRAPAAADAVRDLLDVLPPGHALRTALAGELATVLARAAGPPGAPDAGALDQARILVDAVLAEAGPDDPGRADLTRTLAGLLVTTSARDADDTLVDRIVTLADSILSTSDSTGAVRGRDHFLHAMALMLRGRRDGGTADLRAAAGDLQRALELVPATDPLAPAVVALLGALLHDRYLAGGSWEDADAAAFRLDQALAVARTYPPARDDVATIRALTALSRGTAALRTGDPGAVEATVAELRAVLDALPTRYPWRGRLEALFGLAVLRRGADRRDPEQIREGIAVIERAGTAGDGSAAGRTTADALGAVALLLHGAQDDDAAAVAAAVERLAGLLDAPAVGAPTVSGLERVGLLALTGLAHLVRYQQDGTPAALDQAIGYLERALDGAGDGAGAGDDLAGPYHGHLLPRLAEAYRIRGDRDRAVGTGLAALRAHGAATLLQSGTADALVAARGAVGEAHRVARWCVETDRPELAVQALELGRGLVLHAATSAARVPTMLDALGQHALAAQWAAAADAGPPPWAGWSTRETTLVDLAGGLAAGGLAAGGLAAGGLAAGGAPTQLRRRVLETLAGAPEARLLAAPDLEQISAALRSTGAHALAYLVPGDGGADGLLVVVGADGAVVALAAPALTLDPDGPLTRYLAVRGQDRFGRLARDVKPAGGPADVRAGGLAELCDWAWPAAIEPLLGYLEPGQRRVVLVPAGVLGLVPWHAARYRTPAGLRYAVEDLELSYAASARQLVDAGAREVAPLPASPVLVADPTGGLPGAAAEVRALHDHLYPDATVLGLPGRADGTPEQVLAHLPGRGSPGASLLHLACHAVAGGRPDRSHLRLAGAARLSVAAILRRAGRRPPGAPGGLVVLSACATGVTASDHDEALTLAASFLAAGACAVVGSLWPVPDATTPYLMYLFHQHLRAGMAPAPALRAAQLWMLDPDRRYPPGLPPPPADAGATLADPATWAAFVHHGR